MSWPNLKPCANSDHGRARATILLALLLTFIANLSFPIQAAERLQAGFAKRDITPTEPIRLSGYAGRSSPFNGIADPLAVRAMVLSSVNEDEARSTRILISLDAISVPPEMTRRIERWLSETYKLGRADFVIACTHSHTAPHLSGTLKNLYAMPLSDEETAAVDRYTLFVESQMKDVIAEAIQRQQAAQLSATKGTVRFAANRRGIASSPEDVAAGLDRAPQDQHLRLLRIESDGNLIGLVFQYACHCTTISPDINQVSGDWAGLAAAKLEQLHPGITALPVIGCGADANPQPRGSYDMAQTHAAEIVGEVERYLAANGMELAEFPTGYFGYAGLAPEIPTRSYIDEQKGSPDFNRRNWAELMESTLHRMGRLPETYPTPIHIWRFGRTFDWIFLGGEVVADYQFRLAKEFSDREVWVAGYCDDVFAYVASERMRSEGGYEVDSSMVYYAQPGRWQTGTEDLIVRRVREIASELPVEDRALASEESWKSITVPPKFTVDLLAAEPDVADPVNISFGPDGKVWIAEMGDYPLGAPNGGRVRWLHDTDGDGKLDRSVVFMEELSYPSSVMAWKDGVLVLAGSQLIFARDTDGDGLADKRDVWVEGFYEGNPQHRASGFEWGLDGWIYFCSGMGTREIVVPATGQRLRTDSEDVCIHPETLQVERLVGETQFVRARDEFNRWFGNSNSLPIYHYRLTPKQNRLDGAEFPTIAHLLEPVVSPPVYPRSRTVDRFNDLHTRNRFTSACSSIFCRVDGLGEAMRGAALVCEPVHNLVARYRVDRKGMRFLASRFEEDSNFDFLAGTDPWFRPVRLVNAPDGTIWLLDMQRRVIEHPEWIPEAWQQQVDVRDGSGLGRIYRIRRSDFKPTPLPDLRSKSGEELVRLMSSPNGSLRDLVQQQLILRREKVTEELLAMARSSPSPQVRLQAWFTASLLADDPLQIWKWALNDSDHRIVECALEEADGSRFDLETHQRIRNMLKVGEVPTSVVFAIATSMVDWTDSDPAQEIAIILASDHTDTPEVVWALSHFKGTKAVRAIHGMIAGMDRHAEAVDSLWSAWTRCLAKLTAAIDSTSRDQLAVELFSELQRVGAKPKSPAQQALLYALAKQLRESTSNDWSRKLAEHVGTILESDDEPVPVRVRMLPLLGSSIFDLESTVSKLNKLLASHQPPQIREAAIEVAYQIDSPKIATSLIEVWPTLFSAERSRVATTLMQREPWLDSFLDGIEKGSIRVRDLDASTVQLLKANYRISVRERFEKLLGRIEETPRKDVVDRYLAETPRRGDVERGRTLFQQHCATCHQPQQASAALGPSLAGLNHWTQAQWVHSILDPNQAVEPRYLQYQVLTHAGQVFVGVMDHRDEHRLRIVAADARGFDIDNKDISEIRDSKISMMPDGFEEKLSPTDLADLIAFLRQM